MLMKCYVNGKQLSETEKIFSSSSKRFINAHKEDIEIHKLMDGTIKIFYGESMGVFVLDEKNNQWVHDYGNLYKAKIITKMLNELMYSIGIV